ncbi:MAG: DUF3298 domain-containing protein [Clostridiaceae bacterium]|nr:DUF3298 domain-containing protein [Clostridiaceae bacterium]
MNKLKIVAVFAALLFIIVLNGCAGKEDGTISPVGAYTYMDTFKDGDETYLEVNVEYPKFSGEEGRVDNINSFFENLAEHERNNVEENIAPLAREGYIFARDNDLPFLGCSYEIAWQIKRSDEKCVSVWCDKYENLGGVHPTASAKAYNFDSDGDLITLGELFKSDDYLDIIIPIILDRIKASDEEDMYYLGLEDIMAQSYSAEDFLVSDDGIKIFFQPYSIAPYAAGMPAFDISWSEIGDYITDEWK